MISSIIGAGTRSLVLKSYPDLISAVVIGRVPFVLASRGGLAIQIPPYGSIMVGTRADHTLGIWVPRRLCSSVRPMT